MTEHDWRPMTVPDVLERIRFDRETKLGSVLDVIQLVTGCSQDHASQVFLRLCEHHPEVHQKKRTSKFPGRGQRETPVAPIPVLIEIAWLCNGKNAARFRREGVHVFCRALGGDLSLIDEIKARHGMMEDTLEQEALLEGTGVTVAQANGRADQLEIEERKMKLRHLDMDLRERELRFRKLSIEQALDMSSVLKEYAATQDDPRIRMSVLDASKNTLLLGITPVRGNTMLLTNDDERPLSISTVASDMKMKLDTSDLACVGRIVARKYREKYGKDPVKHDGMANGQMVKINTYFEKDRDIIEDALKFF